MKRKFRFLAWIFVICALSVARTFCSVGVVALAVKTTTRRQVERIAKNDFQPNIHYLHSLGKEFLETPVLITGVLDPSECEQMCYSLMAVSDMLDVNVQRKRKGREAGSTELYHCMLEQGISAVMDSTHDDSRLIFEEGLLERDASLQVLSRRLIAAQEALFTDEDWLQHFPPQLKPSSCVVIAGEGATSTLHRDPLEWTGTSVCLEGSKVWRFLPPVPNVSAVDDSLDSYRLASIAWDEYDTPISAGWQSDYNLYNTRHNDIPSAQSLDELNDTKKWKLMDEIAADTIKLQPNTLQQSTLWTAVQRPGDLLIIPAHWWHQTYALEPSIAIASQRCGTVRDAPRLVHHILETTSLIKDKDVCRRVLRDTYTNGIHGTPKEIVSNLFKELSYFLQ